MTELYRRILLWHKLVAMQTGALALCSAKHRLNRDEARAWSAMFRNVADDIDAFLDHGAFVLDDKGSRVLGYAGDRRGTAIHPQEGQPHVADLATQTLSPSGNSEAASPSLQLTKTGGLRVATRKRR